MCSLICTRRRIKLRHENGVHCVAGAGVEGTVHKSGRKRRIRFGSEAFASEGLSACQQQALTHACQQQGADKVISVLVETASDRHNSSSTTSHSSSQKQSSPDSSPSASFKLTPTPSSETTQPVEPSNSQQAGGSQGGDSESQIWVFAFEDTVHQRSAAALEDLREGSWLGRGRKEKHVRVMMLTGDNEASAQRVAKQLKIDDVRAGLSPEQKLQVSVTAAPNTIYAECWGLQRVQSSMVMLVVSRFACTQIETLSGQLNHSHQQHYVLHYHKSHH